jgi:hypothetical protein
MKRFVKITYHNKYLVFLFDFFCKVLLNNTRKVSISCEISTKTNKHIFIYYLFSHYKIGKFWDVTFSPGAEGSTGSYVVHLSLP